MNCSHVKKRLSVYYDGEFPERQSGAVTRHLSACTACRTEMAGYTAISRMVRELPNPMPPVDLWIRLLQKLENVNCNEVLHTSRRTFIRRLAIAASLLLLFTGLVGVGYMSRRAVPNPQHALMTKTFQQYLDQFQINPKQAHQVLLTSYQGKPVDSTDAINVLGYRPAATERLPEGYSVNQAYILQMPCCVCIHVVCERDDHSVLVFFEHEEQNSEWFQNHPAITVQCDGQPTKVIQIGNQLAATWKTERRYLTVIGLKDMTELTRLRTYWYGLGDKEMTVTPT